MKTTLLIALAFITFTVSAQTEFITTWKTENAGESITIPTKTGEVYNYTVDWGDDTLIDEWQGDAKHTYDEPGEHEVKISGEFPAIDFNDRPSASQIQSIEHWGEQEWTSMDHAFAGCRNLIYNAKDKPNLSKVSSLASTFSGCTNFNGNIGGWDVHNVTDMSSMFDDATSFNRDVSNWNVALATDMSSMFTNAAAFNQDVSSWDVSNVTTMEFMLDGTALSVVNYDALLNGWSLLTLQMGVELGAANHNYCAGA